MILATNKEKEEFTENLILSIVSSLFRTVSKNSIGTAKTPETTLENFNKKLHLGVAEFD